jgi:hypothetical protein
MSFVIPISPGELAAAAAYVCAFVLRVSNGYPAPVPIAPASEPAIIEANALLEADATITVKGRLGRLLLRCSTLKLSPNRSRHIIINSANISFYL